MRTCDVTAIAGSMNIYENSRYRYIFTCKLSQSFWKALSDWMIESSVVDGFTLTSQDVMYGITKECSVLYDLINHIILLAKYFRHKCRYFKSPPLFIVF